MALNIHAELKRLGTLKTPQLKARYAELFGEPTRCNNRPFLIKRIAWRLQADAEGDLSEHGLRTVYRGIATTNPSGDPDSPV